MDNRRLLNASMVGILLAVLGVGLFLLMYVALGAAGAESAVRLFGALCTPPVIIGVAVLLYSAITRRGSNP